MSVRHRFPSDEEMLAIVQEAFPYHPRISLVESREVPPGLISPRWAYVFHGLRRLCDEEKVRIREKLLCMPMVVSVKQEFLIPNVRTSVKTTIRLFPDDAWPINRERDL